MRLRDLNAVFLRIEKLNVYRETTDLAEAQGVVFFCPKCIIDLKTRNHNILCWFADRGVPDGLDPKPGRWVTSGTTIDDLSFIGPGAGSVPGKCGWHGFVKNGDAS